MELTSPGADVRAPKGWKCCWNLLIGIALSPKLPAGCGAAAGIGHNTAGGAGGDAHGDCDGDGLSHLLAALHHVCPGGGHEQRHRHPASSRIPALLLLQDRHGLQSNHLRLHEQTGEGESH